FDWSIAGDALGMEMRNFVAATNGMRWEHPALRSDDFRVVHVDRTNQVVVFARQFFENRLLMVANLGDQSFDDRNYHLPTADLGDRFVEVLCTQNAEFGGRPEAGNRNLTLDSEDGWLGINLPEWSLVALKA